MKSIDEELAGLEQSGENFALISIVEASAGSPGRAGFKRIIVEDGRVFGSVGGGQLEYLSSQRAADMLQNGPDFLLERFILKDEQGGIGMACGGEALVFIERFLTARPGYRPFFAPRHDLLQRDAVLATISVIDAANSGLRQAAKAYLSKEGVFEGLPCDEPLILEALKRRVESLSSSGQRLSLERLHFKELDKPCEAKLLFEIHQKQEELYIFGGGHIGSALTDFASKLGFKVSVIDDRPDYSSATAHPLAAQCLTKSYNAISELSFPKGAYFVIVTHRHVGDQAVLEALLRREDLQAQYLGLIGSRRKLASVFEKMLDMGFSREALCFVNAPIGIDHGGQSANEIALGICAELIARRHRVCLADSMALKKPVLSER